MESKKFFSSNHRIIKKEETMIQIGSNCRDVLREIIFRHSITMVDFRAYYYIPQRADCPRKPFLLKTGEGFESRLEEEIGQLQDGWDIGVYSNVFTDKGKRHIPQIDFELPISPKSQEILIGILEEKIVPDFGGGALLESGGSYHFWGTKRLLYPRDWGTHFEIDWADFMGVLLLTSGHQTLNLVDVRWVGYSLLRGATVLRVSAKTKQVLPHIVAIIE